MEASEKIYLYLSERAGEEYDAEWSDIPLGEVGEDCVEYIRTDAFIEKAIGWLKEQSEIIGVSFQEDFLERFQNYMKGE